MTLNDYREQFRRNMMVMSRTANGKLDLSASATKVDSMAVGSAADAQDKAFENTERALVFLFDNRKRKFKSVKELRTASNTITRGSRISRSCGTGL